MALDIVLSLAQPIIDYAVKPVGRQLGYLFNYKNNVDAFTEELHRLENEQAAVKMRVQSAQRNLGMPLPNVEEWLDKVDRVKDDAGLFLQNEVKENQRCFKWLMFPDLMSRHKVSRRASKEKIAMNGLVNEAKTFRDVATPPPPPPAASRFVGHADDFESRRSVFHAIMDALEDDRINVIGVYGMGGVGKTTLVKEVAKEVEKRKLFVETALATVSQKPNLSKIQHEIAQQLGLDLKEENQASQAGKLSQRLSQSKGGVLVILDDLWDTLKLSDVGIVPTKSCKVILTSRDKSLCTKMDSEKVFEVKILSQDEGLRLFLKEIGPTFNSQVMLPIAAKIVTKCQGLPLAITAIAKSLKGESHDSWTLALRHFQKSTPEKIDGMSKDVYSVLEYSFTFLKPEERLCLLFCGFFEEDTDIPIEDLMTYVMSLRMFRDIDGIEGARLEIRVLVKKLTDRCLLLGGESDDCIRMHDVIRDFVKFIASTGQHGHEFLLKEGESLNTWPAISMPTKYTAISLLNTHIVELPESMDCPKLEVFRFQGKYEELPEIPSNFFSRMTELKVLVIKNTSIRSLPPSIRFLTKLQTLCLERCNLQGNISFISELKDLKILSIRGCGIEEVPIEIGQLEQLMILDLRDCFRLSLIPQNLLSRLTRLECLYVSYRFDQWGLGNNATLGELKYLSCLHTLEIVIPDITSFPRDLLLQKLTTFRISISFYGQSTFKGERLLEMERVGLYNDSDLPTGLKMLVEKSQQLRIVSCQSLVLRCALDVLKTRTCANLRYFYVVGDRYEAEEEIELGLSNCSELRELDVRDCILRNVWKESPSYAFLGNLKFLLLLGCKRLKSLFPQSAAKHLVKLETLEVLSCSSVEEIFIEDDEIELPCLKILRLYDLPSLRSFRTSSNSIPRPTLFDKKVKLPALEELDIRNVGMIEELCSDQLDTKSFCNLKVMAVGECDKLSNLFPANMVPWLTNLNSLSIRKCKSVEVIEIKRLIGIIGGPMDPSLTSRLLQLRLVGLPQLTEMIWNQDGGESFSLRYRIDSLDVEECNGLRYIFVPSVINKHFNHLKRLRIANCLNLEEVVVAKKGEKGGFDVEFSSVESLTLERLPNLRSFCSTDHTFTWPSLKFVHLKKCPNMQTFCSRDPVTPQLEGIRISYASGSINMVWKGSLNSTIQDLLERNILQYRMEIDFGYEVS